MAFLILPAGLLITALLAAPLAILLRISLNHYSPQDLMVEAVTLQNYAQVVKDPYYHTVLGTTLVVALICTLGAIVLGFPAAYTLARMQRRWKGIVTILTLFPLFVGNVIRSAGWLALLGNDGAINAGLRGLGVISAPIQLMYTNTAVVVGIIAVVLPYMILTLSAVIESIPRQTEEAAANLGAGAMTAFRRVIFPLAMPGVVAGSTLVFILCMNAYATPVLLGGPQFKMMAPAVYDQFVRGNNWPLGASLAFILLIVTLVLTAIGSTLLSRRYTR